jgi:hypothetical protein
MTTIVQGMIPERYLLAHAVYMQTCAHIELAVWHIVQIVEGFDRSDPAETERFLKMKRDTWTLINAFGATSEKCMPEISGRISELADRIRLGVENRNFAAHAAIYWDDETSSLASEHYFQRTVDGKKVWLHTLSEPITNDSIIFAVSDADSILREAISIRAELEFLVGHSAG